MRTYNFIIRRICNITGAQQYVYNKTRYLKSQGWRVLIFSSLQGEILIDDFKEYENLMVQEGARLFPCFQITCSYLSLNLLDIFEKVDAQ